VKTEKKLRQESTFVQPDRSWLPFFKKTRLSPPKKKTVQPGDAFEDTTFNPGFEIVIFKPDCIVSALHFFVK
jgi:hypothetical protein